MLELHDCLLFLSENVKIEKIKVEKLNANLHEKKKKNEYVIRIRYSKQALNSGLVLKKSVYNH